MRAGQFRHRVTVKRKVVDRNGFGGEVVTWADLATVWADIRPIGGREYVEAKQGQVDVSHRIYLRDREDIEPAMRVHFKDRVFEIEAVIRPLERKVSLTLMCREMLSA